MTALIRVAMVFLMLNLGSQAVNADEYDDAIKSFRDAGQSGAYFEKSYGYAVFPTIGKGGIGIGGAHGTGKVYAQGKPVGTSKMTQLTIGLQLGGQAYSQVIFFETEDHLKDFTSGNFEFSAQATAVQSLQESLRKPIPAVAHQPALAVAKMMPAQHPWVTAKVWRSLPVPRVA